MAKKRTVPKTGRPRQGEEGQRVRDYPQISVRVSPSLRIQVTELKRRTGWSQLEIFTRAIECLAKQLSRKDFAGTRRR